MISDNRNFLINEGITRHTRGLYPGLIPCGPFQDVMVVFSDNVS